MIEGVQIKELIKHTDERGFFCELIRKGDSFFSEGFGQLSYSYVNQGIIKAWHAHKFQIQWTYFLKGSAKVCLNDFRKDSLTHGEKMEFLCGENHPAMIYKFPPGVLHGYKCLQGPLIVVYVTSGEYDITDEIRLAHNDASIGYDWLHTNIK
jgi:dTDP-4-dehydrorhamnose 3,5-epimerase